MNTFKDLKARVLKIEDRLSIIEADKKPSAGEKNISRKLESKTLKARVINVEDRLAKIEAEKKPSAEEKIIFGKMETKALKAIVIKIEDRLAKIEAENNPSARERIVFRKLEEKPKYDLIVSGTPDEMAADITTFFEGIAKGLRVMSVDDSPDYAHESERKDYLFHELENPYMKVTICQDIRQRKQYFWNEILDYLDNFSEISGSLKPEITEIYHITGTQYRAAELYVEWKVNE